MFCPNDFWLKILNVCSLYYLSLLLKIDLASQYNNQGINIRTLTSLHLLSTLISLINVGPMLTDFEKFHPPQNKNPPSTFIEFLDFSTLHSSFIRVMYYFFPKIPPSTFIPISTFSDLATFAPPPRLLKK